MKLLGFEFVATQDEEDKIVSPVPGNDEDSAIDIYASGQYGIVATDVDFTVGNLTEAQLIEKYREIAMIPEVDFAIEEIISEAVVTDDNKNPISLNMDNLDVSKAIKDKINNGFEDVLGMMSFKSKGHDIFRRWYIDGRYNCHIIIDNDNPKEGVKELRYIDPKKIKKVREIEKKVEPETGAVLPTIVREYYIYNEKGVENTGSRTPSNQGIAIAKEAIAHCNSGLFDSKSSIVLSHLHKAIIPANNLKMLEQAMVIYRLARAPERKAFYVDVGNLPAKKAEQYVTSLMNKYKTKLVYDGTTGELKDGRSFHSMTEDYWIPRREGSRGTEIGTIEGGQQLGETGDLEYFKKKLYRSLNVPTSRLDDENNSIMGRGTEVSRDEVRFSRFINRLRGRFTMFFDDVLGKHLALTGVMSVEEWGEMKSDIHYDFIRDNVFTEMFDTEVLQTRLTLLRDIENYIGTFFSEEYVKKNILRMTQEEVDEIKDQLKKEKADDPITRKEIADQKQNAFEEVEPEPENPVIVEKSEKESDELSESMARFFDSLSETQTIADCEPGGTPK